MTETSESKPLPFVLGKKPAPFWWTVRVPVPVDDDYQFAPLRLKFSWSSQADLNKIRGVGLGDGESMPTDEQIVQRKVRDWELMDEAGAPVPFTPENLALLTAAPMVLSSIVATYMAVMGGVAARKNAWTPPAAG